MKKIIYLLALLTTVPALAQEDCNLQYDGNGDGAVNVTDVLGLLSEFGDECEVPPTPTCLCGGPCDYHGYNYTTVQIGGQCWFAENLRTELFRNGDSILTIETEEEWIIAANVHQAAIRTINETVFNAVGQFYNWYAVDDARGLCPSGWHVPTDMEWQDLEFELGMYEVELDGIGLRSSGQVGTKLKSAPDLWDGTNSSGFNALPAGFVWTYGTYDPQQKALFYTSSGTAPNCWYRELNWNEGVIRGWGDAAGGINVRCIKD